MLDLESEVMRDLGSFPSRVNIFHWIFFCFHVVNSLMPILALLAISSSLWKLRMKRLVFQLITDGKWCDFYERKVIKIWILMWRVVRLWWIRRCQKNGTIPFDTHAVSSMWWWTTLSHQKWFRYKNVNIRFDIQDTEKYIRETLIIFLIQMIPKLPSIPFALCCALER